jgi:hypothetical protein
MIKIIFYILGSIGTVLGMWLCFIGLIVADTDREY